MRKTYWTVLLWMLSALVPSSFIPAKAQIQAEPVATQDTRIAPRFRLNYSGEGGGSTDFTSVEGFVPFDQSADDLTYFTGRLHLDNDANFGGNVLIGYRRHRLESARIYGGYGALDTRNTGSETFYQLGAGFESLGENWDWRLNGYVPVGDTLRSGGTTGPQVTDASFQDNSLVLDIADITDIQSALGGLEVEAGVKFADFKNGGDVRGVGGLYYLDGPEVDGSLGGRFRVEAQPTRFLNVGAGLQYDGIFGTNFLFDIGVSLPSAAPRRRDDSATDLLHRRIAEPVARNHAIVVERQLINRSQADVAAIDPLTGMAYVFQHVDPLTGSAEGSGQFEAPVGAIAQATSLANDGDIIYIQLGGAGGGFTIPDGVQVLSVGPLQTVPTQFGNIQLPGSGSGDLPTITAGSVVLGSRTVLSGIEIVDAVGDAILGEDISDVVVQGNRTNAALGAGIKLEDVGGNVQIEDNQFNNSIVDSGIFITTGDSVVQQLTVTGNTLSGNAEQGLFIRATDAAEVNADVQNNQSTGNNLADNTRAGIEIEAQNAAPGQLCLNFVGNSSDTNAELTNFSEGKFQVVNQADFNSLNASEVAQLDSSDTTAFENVATCR